MSTFLEDESGVETSRPREGILFETPAFTEAVALGSRNVKINGRTYKALPAQRGELTIAMAEDEDDLVVQLPVSHRIPQRWMFGRVPPLYVNVTLYRLQVESGEVEALWRGKVESMTIDLNDVASLRVPARLTDAHSRRIPQATVSKMCSRILYDPDCRVDRAGFTHSATVDSFDGRIITVDSMGAHPTDWATFGEILHPSTGERITIASQIGRVITMQFNLPGLAIGDAVTIFAGCAHNMDACSGKFANQVNFGGYPQLPTKNVFRRTRGFGVMEQY